TKSPFLRTALTDGWRAGTGCETQPVRPFRSGELEQPKEGNDERQAERQQRPELRRQDDAGEAPEEREYQQEREGAREQVEEQEYGEEQALLHRGLRSCLFIDRQGITRSAIGLRFLRVTEALRPGAS